MNTSSITMNKAMAEREKRECRAMRREKLFDALSITVGVISGCLLMWLFISFFDFSVHDLATDFSPLKDLWLGRANLVYLICSLPI